MTAAQQPAVAANNGMRWLVTEVGARISAVRKAVDGFCDHRDDAEPLLEASAELASLRSIFSVVQSFGAADLAGEMRKVCLALAGKGQAPVSDPDNALTALLGACVQLGDYVDMLAEGHPDALLVFHPTINELRVTIGAQVLTEQQHFARHMLAHADLADAGISSRAPAKADAALRKLVPALHAALSRWTKQQARTESLKRIGKIAEHLSAHMTSPALDLLCRTLAASAEALLGLKLTDSIAVQRLMNQSGALLIRCAKAGAGTFARDAAQNRAAASAAFQLMYLLAASGADGRRARALRSAYGLDELLPPPDEVEALRSQMRGPNIAVLNRVAGEIRDELSTAKDDIDLAVRTGDASSARFDGTLGMLKRVSDTLGMLGLAPLQKHVERQTTTLEALIDQPATDERWLDVASALLQVEHRLDEALFGQLGAARGGVPFDPSVELAPDRISAPPQSDVDDGVQAAIRESLVNVSQLKQYIASYIANGDAALLGQARRMLLQVQSVLAVAGASRAGLLSERLTTFMGRETVPLMRAESDVADAFADAVAAIEYYLEALQQKLPRLEHYLDSLTQALDRLDLCVADHVARGAAPNAEQPPADTQAPAAHQAVDADPVDDEFKAIFVEEAGDVIDTIRPLLDTLKPDAVDVGALTEIRRGFHTLKGSGRMVGALDLAELSWGVEQLLNRCLDGAADYDDVLHQRVQAVVSTLPEAVAAFESGRASAALAEQMADHDQAISMLLHGPQGGDRAHNPTYADPELFRVFREDAKTRVDEWQAAVAAVHAGGETARVPETLVRALHTLAGSAGALGFEAVSDLCGTLERLCELRRSQDQALPAAELDLLGASAEAVEAQLDAAGDVGSDAGTLTELLAQARERLENLKRGDNGTDLEAAEAARNQFANAAADQIDGAEGMLSEWQQAAQQRDLPAAQAAVTGVSASLNRLGELAEAQRFEEIEGSARALLMQVDAASDRAAEVPAAAWFDAAVEAVEQLYQMVDARQAGRPPVDAAPITLPDAFLSVAIPLAGSDAELAENLDAGVPADQSASAQQTAQDDAESRPDAGASAAILDEQAEDARAMRALFVEEASARLDAIDQSLAALEQRPDSATEAADLRDQFHTLKGASRAANIAPLGSISLQLESVLNCALIQQRPLTGAERQHVHSAVDALHALILTSADFEDDALALQARSVIADIDHVLAAQAATAVTAPTALHARMGASVEPAQDVVDAIVARERGLRQPESPDTGLAPSSDAAAPAADAVDPEVAEIFLEEAHELLEHLATCATDLRGGSPDALDEARRILHTLKGGARMTGLVALGDAVHSAETDVEELADTGGAVDSSRIAALLEQQHEQFSRHVDHAERSLRSGDAAAANELEPAAASAPARDAPSSTAPTAPTPQEAAADSAQAAASASSAGWDQRLFWQADETATSASTRRETARVTVDQLDAMLNQAGEVGIAQSRLEQQMNEMAAQLLELERTIERLTLQLRALNRETDAQIQALSGGEAAGKPEADRYGEAFDALEMDRYTGVQEVSRSLAEAVSDLSNLHDAMRGVLGESNGLLVEQSRVQTTLQQNLMGTLMVPFSRQEQRLRRLIRQTAEEQGKRVNAEFSGIESELDRNVLERMTAPLEHLLRNAVVHGIETPADRQAAGKSANGTIELSLKREGTQLLVEVSDDGGGLDLMAIRARAVERGLIGSDVELSDEAVASYIFTPGFSTAESVSQAAGRGVGMDVVAAEVNALGGTVDVRSEFGRGVTFQIRLPLSLAVSQALLVRSGDETYAVPIGSVDAVSKADANAAQVDYGGQTYAVRPFASVVGGEPDADDDAARPVLLVKYAEGLTGTTQHVALAVDGLIGTREIVSKPLGAQVGSIVGIAGATILSDGRVVFILDVPALMQRAAADASASAADTDAPAAQELAADHRQAEILVVDDSVTMRRVAERLLTRAGYEVETARDGLDALAKLQTRRPDLVLLDIEMPRMDGFEVAAFIRNTAQLSDVPIIMITSRSSQKHRARAAELGVNQYLTKPYQESVLLDEIGDKLPAGVRAAAQDRQEARA